jgi:hypothetical protein
MAHATHTEMEGHALHNESDIGPPNAEPHGLWRILRNSLVVTAVIMFLVAVIFVR